jgi:hypothetical protein
MKQVPNSPNYCITLDGKLFSLTRMKYVKPSYDRDGYVFYRMSYKSREFQKKAHRLVAITYLPNPLNKSDVNHIDGKKDNNLLCNLEWMTKSENAKHAWDTGLQKRNRNNGKLVIDLETGIFYDSCKEASIAKGMVYDLLKHRLRGRTINNTSLKYI